VKSKVFSNVVSLRNLYRSLTRPEAEGHPRPNRWGEGRGEGQLNVQKCIANGWLCRNTGSQIRGVFVPEPMAKSPHFGGMLKKELAIWEEEANLAMSY
jgi:hypothetical protein